MFVYPHLTCVHLNLYTRLYVKLKVTLHGASRFPLGPHASEQTSPLIYKEIPGTERVGPSLPVRVAVKTSS